MQKLILQPTIIISVISALISVIVCIISIGQYQLQKKMYKDGNPKIDFNIEKGILYKERLGCQKVYNLWYKFVP